MMGIDPKLIDQLLAEHGHRAEDIAGEEGLPKQLTKAVLERAMNAELTDHLGYTKHDPAGYNSGNSRNGKSRKKLKGDFGEMELETPRDRNGTFEPKIVPKHQTRWTGFDDKILSMYARGMTTREIQAHLEEIYGVEVSPTLVSTVTEAVQDEVRAWQSRPLEPLYPIVYLDALYVHMRDNGHVQNRALYIAIGVNLEGQKEVLGLWTSPNEGAKFWLQVLTEMKNRGVQDVFIACVDGRASRKQSKPCSRKRKCNCASCIWFGTAWVMCLGSSVVGWRRICGPSIPRRRPMKRLVSWTSSGLSGTRRIRLSARCGAAIGSA
jgi:putative transposase